MKRTFITILTISAFIFGMTACTNNDDADAFVGTYSVSTIENVVWGSSSGTLNDIGTLTIRKTSPNQVQVTGMYNTTGEVIGDYLYLVAYSVADASGSLTYTFNAGYLNGNVLTFNAYYTGQLKSNGTLYPIRSNAQVTCIKQ